ncbi:unnamed protein product [Rotaria sp. Silwood1]|nr:unnamed protein product [Rotaria sp. Silwood1]CAF3420718.1 unnamed protein product [Rotaria sp. Silwood1]CAF3434230.1 unnamed protein product [Rotaria sp. Silwood1]CAF4685356.1 unnamed protein product [Rotaria sp. Silwood1]
MLLENDNFLTELTKLFQQQRVKNSGSLSLVMKRYDGRTKPKPKLTKKQRLEKKPSSINHPTTHEAVVEYKCLVRAVYGSKKLSTIVSSKDINRFQLAYSNLLKANMDTLKKKAKENKAAGQTSTNTNSNVPLSPRATTTTTASSPSSVSNQQKKTPTAPAKKK